MTSISSEFKTRSMSLRSHLGSLLATVAVFLAIASTGLHPRAYEADVVDERPVYYLAPPKDFPDTKTVARESSQSVETYSVDMPETFESEELTLDSLKIDFRPDISSEVALNFDMDRDFKASAPEMGDLDRFAIYDEHEVDERPVVRYAKPPTIPTRLRGETVEVITFYYVTADGRTESQSVLHSSSEDPTFADAAIDAISSWRFRPARKNGKNVACWVQQPIVFQKGSTSPFTL